jgi:tetratricopeptide (TPR) repeat protein
MPAFLLSLLCAATGPVDRPTVLFDQGTAHYRAGEFKQAIGEFLEADRLRPNPALAYDIAQSYEKLADPERARDYYRLYLQRAPAASDRIVIEATVRSLDSWIDSRRLAGEDPGANLRAVGFYSLGAGALAGALGLAATVAGDAEPNNNPGAANAFHVTADVCFLAGGIALISAGSFFILAATGYADHQAQSSLRLAPSGFAVTF